MLLLRGRKELNVFVLTNVLISLQVISEVEARVKRCYVCRSRGPLGDCRDAFELNTTTVEESAVEAQPCASGWCGKSIEGEDEGQHLMATERMCLQRPPSDQKERCAQTFYGNKKKTFFMCFCRGDLCNAGQPLHPTYLSVHVVIFSLIYLPTFYS